MNSRVKGMTDPCTMPPVSHQPPPPASQAATEAIKLNAASDACITAARL